MRADQVNSSAPHAAGLGPLIYIIASGRSGSTLIERAISSSARVVALGEVHQLWRLPLEEVLCSCGCRTNECPFWTELFRTLKLTDSELKRLLTLEQRVVRNTFLASKLFNLDRIGSDPEVREFLGWQERIFAEARRISGAQIVVDSSKAGPRGWILASGQSPLFLHLRRDASAVLHSWSHPKYDKALGRMMIHKGAFQATSEWAKVESSVRLIRRNEMVQRIDYATFCEHPRKTLSDALDDQFTGLTDSMAWLGEKEVQTSSDYHTVGGNPDRYERGSIKIVTRNAQPSAQGPDGKVLKKPVLSRTLAYGLNRLFP